jgi:hypothetical protein
MDEDVLVRAITIGASVFITLATVTAVMIYYNTARATVSEIGTGTNIEQQYREDIKNNLNKTELTGAEVKNVLQYFYDSPEITISMTSYYAYHKNGYQIVWIPLGETGRINSSNNSSYTLIMKSMMPNQKFAVTQDVNNSGKYTFTLK